MTSPKPTKVATTAKSTESGGAATNERSGVRSWRERSLDRAIAALLRTGGLPQCIHGSRELLAAIFGRFKHVERRAAGREQNHVAGLCEIASAVNRVLHRAGALRFFRRGDTRNFFGRLSNGDQAFGAFANRRAHLVETGALGAAAGDQNHGPIVCSQRRDDRTG